MLTIPLRYSTNVPRLRGNFTLAIYFKQKSTRVWYLSSPRYWMKLLLERGLPKRIAVNPFSAKQKSKRVLTLTPLAPSCSCCFARSEPPTCEEAEKRTIVSTFHTSHSQSALVACCPSTVEEAVVESSWYHFRGEEVQKSWRSTYKADSALLP